MPNIGEFTHAYSIGLAGRSKMVWLACPICGMGHWVRWRSGNPVTQLCISCCQSNYSDNEIRGRKVTKAGYVLVLLRPKNPYYCMVQKSGYCPEHRYIMAKHLGRPLEFWEVVHQKNQNKSDNRLSNLHLYPSVIHKGRHIEWKLATRIKQLEQRVTLLEAENELLKSQTSTMPSIEEVRGNGREEERQKKS